MSIRQYVKKGRIIVSPHICLLCKYSSQSQNHYFFKKSSTVRYYAAAAAANAVSKPHSTSSNSLSGISKSASSSTKNDGINSPGTKPRKSGHRTKAKAEKQVQEEEIRRKALATRDKSTRFIAAGLNMLEVEPTLSDLDFFKPTSPPLFGLDFVYPEATTFLQPRAPKDSALDRYDEVFGKLVNTLTSKFNKKQLVALYRKGIDRPAPKGQGQPRPMKKLKTTRDFASEIVRWRWKWPYLRELVDRKTYLTSKVERILHLKTNEFFLLLGSNGSTFRELTDQFGVTLTQVKRTDTGFDLSVTGLSYSLDQLALVLKMRREQIITELMTPGSFSRPRSGQFVYGDSLRRISKQTNALVEELSSGKFQISALEALNINAAKRLVFRTQQQLMHRAPSFASVGDTNAEEYSLFPLDIYRPDRMPLHWNSSIDLDAIDSDPPLKDPVISSSETHHSHLLPSIFRIRKIMHTFGSTFLPQQNTNDSVSLELRSNDDVGIFSSLKRILERPSFLGETRRKTITASFGQIAFTPTKTHGTSLFSPLQSPFSLSRLFDWMQDNTSKITFIPEIPPLLVKLGISTRIAHTRLIYRMITGLGGISSVLTFDIKRHIPEIEGRLEVSASPLTSSLVPPTSSASLDLSADLRDIFAEEGLNKMFGDNLSRHEFKSVKQENDPLSSFVQIWHNTENVVDVTFPSRPMDIRFSSFESMRVALSDVPTEMQDHIRQYVDISVSNSESQRPLPPLTLEYKKNLYTLDSYASIRSTTHYIHQPPVTIEEATDHESNERFMKCLVTYSGPRNSRDWEAFINCCVSLNRSEITA